MTFDLPVLIWTVINFCLLMLLLNKLLFKPMLAFMDARRSKIDSAAEARAEIEKSHTEQLLKKAEHERELQKKSQEDAVAQLEQAREKSAELIKTATSEYDEKLKKAGEQLADEKNSLVSALEPRIDVLAKAFTDALLARLEE